MDKTIRDYMSEQGRKGGAAKTAAKAEAAKANGAKGGRPAVLYDDGERSVVQLGTTLEGRLVRVESRVFGKRSGGWLLGADVVKAIRSAKDSDEVFRIIAQAE